MNNALFLRLALGCCAVAVAVALACAPASARIVEVHWTPGAEGDAPATREQARAAAFRDAVLAEAADLLPGALSAPRQELLRQHLLPRAADYVQSYAEAAAPEAALAAPQGATALRLDVTVNRPALRRTLQRMGVYYTVRAPRDYDLALEGEAGASLDEIARLQELSGLRVRRGVQPLVALSRDAQDGSWTGRLDQDGQSWTARGAALADVWFELLGHYFSRPGAEAGVVDQVALTVRGWSAADGVKAFDAELGSWDGLVEGRVLTRVLLLPEGVAGVWTVRTLDPEALGRRLAQTLPPRGLAWEGPGARPAP
jgi:hypothetical protein